MGSTGRKKGPASFIRFKVRTVEPQKRHWARLSVEGPAGVIGVSGVGTGVFELEAMFDDAGGGVADFRNDKSKRIDGLVRPCTAHEDGKVTYIRLTWLVDIDLHPRPLSGGRLGFIVIVSTREVTRTVVDGRRGIGLDAPD